MTSTNPGYTNYSASEAVTRAKSYGSWDTNMCMNFVWYQLSYPDTYGIPDANAGWDRAKRKHTGSDKGAPPAGAPVYWSTSHPYGHVALSVGGGNVRSTDWPGKGDVGTVDIDQMSAAWGMTLRGWTEDLCGDTIAGLMGDDDMPLSDADVKAIAAAVWDRQWERNGLGPWTAEQWLGLAGEDSRATNDRVMGMLRQKYYVMEDGVAKEVPKGTAGATPTDVLDTIDGNSIMRNIDAVAKDVWDRQWERNGQGPWAAFQWTGLAAEAADETRDAVNALQATPARSTFTDAEGLIRGIGAGLLGIGLILAAAATLGGALPWG